MTRLAVAVLMAALLLAGCSADSTDGPTEERSPSASGARFPDVVQVQIEPEAEGSYRITVTMSSPYDSPQRYADGWRVTGPDGTVYATTTLGHDHASEQPFTRTQTGVEVPDGVDTVVVEGRDTENGYGGGTVTADLPDR